MFKTNSKVLIIAIILIAFVGQVLVFNTSIPCDESDDSYSATSLTSNTNEALKDLELSQYTPVNGKYLASAEHIESSPYNDSKEDCCGIECCSTDCICFTNGCSSFAYFAPQIYTINTLLLSNVIFTLKPAQTNAVKASVYRPPIFTA